MWRPRECSALGASRRLLGEHLSGYARCSDRWLILGVKPRLALRCGQISGSGLRVSRVDLSLCLTLGEV